MLSSAELFGLVVYLFAYLAGAYEVYELYVDKTNRRFYSAVYALLYPITLPIFTFVLPNHLKGKHQNEKH